MIYKFDRQFCADGLTMGQMKLEIKRRGWWAGKIDTDRLINGDGRIMIVRVARSSAALSS